MYELQFINIKVKIFFEKILTAYSDKNFGEM